MIFGIVKIIKLLMIQFSPANMLLSTEFSFTLSLCPSLSTTDWMSCPCRVMGKIVYMTICVFTEETGKRVF
jgi:hypothetical protein